MLPGFRGFGCWVRDLALSGFEGIYGFLELVWEFCRGGASSWHQFAPMGEQHVA